MDTNSLIRDMLNMGYVNAFKKNKVPVQQEWPPAWLEYEQPGANVYSYNAPVTALGFYDRKNNRNDLFYNSHPLARQHRTVDEVVWHEGEHRQQYDSAEQRGSHWSRFQRETPKDLENLIKRHLRTSGNDVENYSEAMATLAALKSKLQGRDLKSLMDDLQANQNWNKEYQYDFHPMFNIKD